MALSEGVHTVFATTTDAAGNNAVDQHDFVVDLTAPVVDVTGPTGRTADPTPTLTGTSEPGASVQVFVDGALVATVTAGTDGNWSVDVISGYKDKQKYLKLYVVDENQKTEYYTAVNSKIYQRLKYLAKRDRSDMTSCFGKIVDALAASQSVVGNP